MTLYLSSERGIVQNLMFLKGICYDFTGFETGLTVLFVDVRHILNNYRSQALPLDE